MGLVFGGGNTAERQAVSRALKAGKLLKLHAGIYTTEVDRNPSEIVRENLWEIAARLFPGAVISHRSALDPRPTPEGYFFVTHKRNRRIDIHGLTLVEISGAGAIDGDRPMGALNIFQSQYERALLENLQRSKGDVHKSLGRNYVEKELFDRLLKGGDKELNRIRDNARQIATKVDMEKEFKLLDISISALLSTQPSSRLSSETGKAMAAGEPFDSERLKMLESLALDLDKEVFTKHPKTTNPQVGMLASFFEAYFSNYIEGTILTVEEAKEVIDTKQALANKRDDSHDVLGTFMITSDPRQMNIIPKTPDELLDILRGRHATLLHARTDKSPGVFKMRNNQAGSYAFVDHKLVRGTLKRGFKFYEFLKDPVARAFYVMFMIAEVHPFEDGNGRIARIMMNAELNTAGQTKIIIPNVYRTDYLGALRAMSLRYNSIPCIRMLKRAFDFSATVTQTTFDGMREYLRSTNAFETEEGFILRF